MGLRVRWLRGKQEREVDELEWDVCEVEFVCLTKPDRAGRRICRFLARARGAGMAYIAGMSLPFWSSTAHQAPGNGEGADGLRALRTELLRDGWEPLPSIVASTGPVSRFRRPARPSTTSSSLPRRATCQMRPGKGLVAQRAS